VIMYFLRRPFVAKRCSKESEGTGTGRRLMVPRFQRITHVLYSIRLLYRGRRSVRVSL